MITGRLPRSPERSRVTCSAQVAGRRPGVWISRSSARSAATAVAASSAGVSRSVSSSAAGRGSRPRDARCGTTLSDAPVMAATSCSVVASSTRKSAALRPSRSTTIRSATAWTSAMLWLIRITPSPVSRSRSTRLSTSAVWATPSAAVGSSSMTTFGLADQAAGDGDGLSLAAGERRDRDPHRGDLGRQGAQQPPRLLLHRRPRRGPRGRWCAPGRGTGWRRRRGCRTARGPGTRWRCRAAWASAGPLDARPGCRRRRSRRSSGW